jgi:hypothetical protein
VRSSRWNEKQGLLTSLDEDTQERLALIGEAGAQGREKVVYWLASKLGTECQRCGTGLAQDAAAFACSHGCTFCWPCAKELDLVCPNCGGKMVSKVSRP